VTQLARRPAQETSPHNLAGVLVLRAQVALFVALVICTAAMPRFLFSTDMGGVSNYGTHATTVVPYTAGYAAAVWLLWRAAATMGGLPGAGGVVAATRVSCCCMAANLATTFAYRTGAMWATVHSWTAIALAVAEFVGGVVLLRAAPRRDWRVAGTALVVLGFACLVLTYAGRLHVLFVAEVATAAGFGVALIGAVRALGLTAETPPGSTSRRA